MAKNIGQLGFNLGKATPVGNKLVDRFVVPPFTVLDARQGYWQKRKEEWLALGIRGEEGREDLGSTVASGWVDRGTGEGGSIFDPVLCEAIYKWFCPVGGHILDPFAGGSTRGIVAAYLGYGYTGIELRAEQVRANILQAIELGIKPNWVVGDSAKLEELLPVEVAYDFAFTSPPYYNLEAYSDTDGDVSTKPSYFSFLLWYEIVFRQVVAKLRSNRFLVVQVGEIKDKNGIYYNFVGHTVNLFIKLGLKYYNEAILVTPVGSLPIRTQAQFPSYRKLGKGHQNILVFYKGNPKKINELFIEE